MATSKHLIGAIRGFLLAQPALVAQLRGGIADGQADRDAALPYVVLESKDLSTLRLFGGKEVQFVRVDVAVFAAGREAAEAIGNLARDLVLPPDDATPWTPLDILGGWTDTNRQPAGGDAIEVDPETRAAFGKDVWCCRRPITWTLARG